MLTTTTTTTETETTTLPSTSITSGMMSSCYNAVQNNENNETNINNNNNNNILNDVNSVNDNIDNTSSLLAAASAAMANCDDPQQMIEALRTNPVSCLFINIILYLRLQLYQPLLIVT